jgi:hypothetical protein
VLFRSHIFVASQDIGSCIFPRSAEQAIYLQSLGDLREVNITEIVSTDPNLQAGEALRERWKRPCFSFHKDIVIPPYSYNPATFTSALRCVGERQRTVLGYFRGTLNFGDADPAQLYSKGGRQWLARNLAKDGRFVVLEGRVPDAQYLVELRSSVFCFSPAGWVSYTFRLFQIMAAGCLPVLFIDPESPYALPFAANIDYSQFVTEFSLPKLRSDDVANTLESIAVDTQRLQRMRSSMAFAVKALEYNAQPHRRDSFEQIIESLKPQAAGAKGLPKFATSSKVTPQIPKRGVMKDMMHKIKYFKSLL